MPLNFGVLFTNNKNIILLSFLHITKQQNQKIRIKMSKLLCYYLDITKSNCSSYPNYQIECLQARLCWKPKHELMPFMHILIEWCQQIILVTTISSIYSHEKFHGQHLICLKSRQWKIYSDSLYCFSLSIGKIWFLSNRDMSSYFFIISIIRNHFMYLYQCKSACST